MSYLGNTTQNVNYVPAVDYFNGNGSTTAFTLSRPVASVAAVQAVINNVPQNPGDAFSVLNNTITFTSAPPSGTNNIYVYYTSPNTQVVQPGQGTVGATQVDGNYALWNKSGSDINYTAGNVGVGTSSPAYKLDVASTVSRVGVNGASYLALGAYTSDLNNYLIGTEAGSFAIYQGKYGGSYYERMRIDSSGRVTMPYQPYVRLSGNPSSHYSGTTGYPTNWWDVNNNVGNHWNNATGLFTCPIAGRYLVMFKTINAGSSSCDVHLDQNGNWITSAYDYVSVQHAHSSLSAIVNCAANDTLGFSLAGASAVIFQGAHTSASIYLLG